MRSRFFVLAVIAACSGDPADEQVTLAFVTPTTGASFARDQLGATGDLVARIDVAVTVTGAPFRVGLTAGSATEIDLIDGAGIAEARGAGALTLTANAYDDLETVIATATVDVAIADPAPADCHAWLDLYRVGYTAGPSRPGVVDPVTATVPLNGIAFRGVGAANPRATLFADCNLILSLARAVPYFHDRGIVEITDYGIYNYRCIGGGTPPNCPNGISQHAYANAIDLAGFTDGNGDFSSVNDDWVIDPDSEDTCAAPTEAGKDEFLHELICTLKTAGLWTIVLTPNYNADHRNHFHVDLTPDSDFIERRGSPHHH